MRQELGDAWECASEIVFIVVATPVEEVGRDHDFDWAIIEPSSMHSIIQTAGRVNRHRRLSLPSDVCNVAVLDQNRRAFVKNTPLAFVQPGFEAQIDGEPKTTHESHQASQLLGLPLENQHSTLLPENCLVIGQHLLFGDKKTRFQECDENAQRLELEHLAKKMQPGSVLWWSQWPAKRYPLREDSNEIEFSFQILEIGKAKVLCHNGEEWRTIEWADIVKAPPVALGEGDFGYNVVSALAKEQGRDRPEFWVVSAPDKTSGNFKKKFYLDWTGFFVT